KPSKCSDVSWVVRATSRGTGPAIMGVEVMACKSAVRQSSPGCRSDVSRDFTDIRIRREIATYVAPTKGGLPVGGPSNTATRKAPFGAFLRVGSKPAGSGLLLRRDHHHHLPAFKARARLDHDVLAQIGLDPGGH